MKHTKRRRLQALLLFASLGISQAAEMQLPVSATLTTETLGESRGTATNSVFRIVLKDESGGLHECGTGFLHKSGRVITAWHVVESIPLNQVRILTSLFHEISVTNCIKDTNLDIAILTTAQPIAAVGFTVSTNSLLAVGTPVITWGYPGGYTGMEPLLSAGHAAGFQRSRLTNGVEVNRVVVNAAFNGGNSGGPLLDVESKTVAGVVVSKMAPIPQYIKELINVLAKNPSGLNFGYTDGSGKPGTVSESQILAEVINYLRSQVQLVIGYAVPTGDLRAFLMQQGIDP